MSDEAELRQLVAAEHGLLQGAESFLRGDTLAEVEASAVQLKKLLGTQHEHNTEAPVVDEQETAPNLYAAAATGKAERQRALVNLLTGRAPQPRDERGRFTTGGFDGGARQRLPPPPESHGSWLTRILRSRAADSGGEF